MSTESSLGKTRKRSTGKPTSRQDVSKVKVTLYISGDLEKRFAVHAIHSGLDRSELFAEMVRQHCRRYVVSDRLKGPGDEDCGVQEADSAREAD